MKIKECISKMFGKIVYQINKTFLFKLKIFKFDMRRLQDSFNNQSSVSEAQLEEINKLRFHANQEENMRIDLLVI